MSERQEGKSLNDFSSEDIQRLIDGKSGIKRIKGSKNYYHNGVLVKLEFKSFWEKLWYNLNDINFIGRY